MTKAYCWILFLGFSLVGNVRADLTYFDYQFADAELRALYERIKTRYLATDDGIETNPPAERITGRIIYAVESNLYVVVNLWAASDKTTVLFATHPGEPALIHGTEIDCSAWRLGTVEGEMLGYEHEMIWYYLRAFPTLKYEEFITHTRRTKGQCFTEIREYVEMKRRKDLERSTAARQTLSNRKAAEAAAKQEAFRMKDAQDFRR